MGKREKKLFVSLTVALLAVSAVYVLSCSVSAFIPRIDFRVTQGDSFTSTVILFYPLWYAVFAATALGVLKKTGEKDAGRFGVLTGVFFVLSSFLNIFCGSRGLILHFFTGAFSSDVVIKVYLTEALETVLCFSLPLAAGIVMICFSARRKPGKEGTALFAALFGSGALVSFFALTALRAEAFVNAFNYLVGPGRAVNKLVYCFVFACLAFPGALLLATAFIVVRGRIKRPAAAVSRLWFVPGAFYLSSMTLPSFIYWILATVLNAYDYAEIGAETYGVWSEIKHSFFVRFGDFINAFAIGIMLLMFGYWFMRHIGTVREIGAKAGQENVNES